MTAADRLVDLLAKPSIEYRPEVRWWLAEGLHTDETPRPPWRSASRTSSPPRPSF